MEGSLLRNGSEKLAVVQKDHIGFAYAFPHTSVNLAVVSVILMRISLVNLYACWVFLVGEKCVGYATKML